MSERMLARSREEFRLAEESRRSSHARIADSPVAVRRPALNATTAFIIGWLFLGVLIVADYFVFRALGIQFFHWYVRNGALINVAFSFISLAVVLDAYDELISSNPVRYLFACFTLWLHLVLAWDATTDKGADDRAEQTWWLPALFDNLVSLIASVVMILVTLGWLLVVAPVQHLAYAVFGSPGAQHDAGRRDLVVRPDDGHDHDRRTGRPITCGVHDRLPRQARDAHGRSCRRHVLGHLCCRLSAARAGAGRTTSASPAAGSSRTAPRMPPPRRRRRLPSPP